jgi:hypothetical protein
MNSVYELWEYLHIQTYIKLLEIWNVPRSKIESGKYEATVMLRKLQNAIDVTELKLATVIVEEHVISQQFQFSSSRITDIVKDHLDKQKQIAVTCNRQFIFKRTDIFNWLTVSETKFYSDTRILKINLDDTRQRFNILQSMSSKLQELYIKTKSELSKCMISNDFSEITLHLSETNFIAIDQFVDTVCLEMSKTAQHIDFMDQHLKTNNEKIADSHSDFTEQVQVPDTLFDLILRELPIHSAPSTNFQNGECN